MSPRYSSRLTLPSRRMLAATWKLQAESVLVVTGLSACTANTSRTSTAMTSPSAGLAAHPAASRRFVLSINQAGMYLADQGGEASALRPAKSTTEP